MKFTCLSHAWSLVLRFGLIASMFLPLAGGMLRAEQPPNILLIQADDLGYCDLGIHGNRVIRTPHLDRLGRESMRFTQFYVHSVCAPTRSSLMTGRHFWRTGVTGVHGGTDFMNLDETTVAQVLSDAGYSTGMWGKWHCGKTDGYYPWDRGFDESYMAALYHYVDNEGRFNGKPVQSKGWTTAVLTDYAIDFMKRKKGQPFFAYVPYLSPHGIWKAPEEYAAQYRDGFTKPTAMLFGMITHLDYHIGRLLAAVDELGLRDSTVVIFLSDNGPIGNVGNMKMTAEEWAQRIAPMNLRGNKGTLYENGIRSPLFIRWGSRLEPVDNDRLLCVMDIFPTLVDLAGGSLPEGGKTLDGKSFARLLMEGDEAWPDREMFFANPAPRSNSHPNKYRATQDKSGMVPEEQLVALRTDHYKYLQAVGRQELFEIRGDEREENNVASALGSRVGSMRNKVLSWFKSVHSELGSFTRPLLLVGYGGESEVALPAYCAAEVKGGLANNTHSLDNWRNPGDEAVFLIDVQTAGVYSIDLSFRSETLVGPVEFAVSSGGESVVCRVGEGPPVDRIVSNSGLFLPVGRTTVSVRLKSLLAERWDMTSLGLTRIGLN